MSKLRLLAAGGALAVAVTLAGCGSAGENHDMGSMASPSGAPTGSGTGTPAAGPHGEADVAFAQMMVPHHRQAIEMADMLLAKQGIDARVTTLATQIKAAQTPEIDRMNGWLAGWGQSAGQSMDMGGTMSRSEMDALDQATGDEAARLFLSGMVKHHRGAVDMAEDELAKGQNADAQQLATSIRDTQQVEIDRMNALLEQY